MPLTTEVSRVTVIIPSYNTGSTIKRAIDSVAATKYPNLEMIIVDDGSSDNSLQVIHESQKKYKWIRLLTHPGHRNRGIASSRNLAIRYSTGQYITFLDADDEFLSNRFDTCISILDDDSDINVIYEPYDLVHVSGKRSEAMKSTQAVGLMDSMSDAELFLYVLKHGGMPHTTSVTIRRTALLDTDLFPQLKYCLEKPLWLQLYCRGGIRAGADQPVARYYLHEKSTCAVHEDTAAFRFEDVRALLIVYRWMKRKGITGPMLEALKSKVFSKYIHYTSYARSIRYRLWSDILMAPISVLRDYPQILFNACFWRATIRMFIGKYIPNHEQM